MKLDPFSLLMAPLSFVKLIGWTSLTSKILFYLFERVSGLSINFAKSSLVYFGKFAHRGDMLAGILNCPLEKLPFKYLGLPLKSANLTRRDWQPLIDKFHRRLSCWKGSTLSIGGRLVLVNSVLSSLPLYYLSFFKLPCWVINKLMLSEASFFWERW